MASVTSLDHDMRKLRLERYTPSAANEVKTWIEETLGERIQGELLDALRDGVALCKLMNLALPTPGIRFKTSQMPFTQRENISHFLNACERPPFNMPAHDRFLTVDLYDEKDPAQVIQCLGAFSRAANAINPSKFPTTIGPKRGAPSPTKKVAEGSSYFSTPSRPGRGSSNASQGLTDSPSATKSPPNARTMSPSFTGGSTGIRTPESASRSPAQVSSWSKRDHEGSTAPAWNIHQYGYMGGASQGNQGVVFGAPRQITSAAPQVPSKAEKDQRMRQQMLEMEQQDQRRREEEARRKEEEAQQERERRAQREREEEQQRLEEKRMWEEETRKAQERQREDNERQRLEAEREREELRKAREEELRAVERDKAERKRFEEQHRADDEDARRKAGTSRTTTAQPSVSAADARTSENERIRDLERQLQEAKERERQYMQERQSVDQNTETPASTDQNPSLDDSITSDDKSTSSDQQPLQPARSGGPRPLPSLMPKPAIAPKPRAYPFARPTKPLDAPKAQPQPAPPTSASAEPPAEDTKPSPYSSARPGHATRTDQYLASNPAPVEQKPTEHVPQEMGMTSTSERDAEDSRRVAAQQQTKAGGWASRSLLEREMERERERQREWEENQMAKAKANGYNNRGIMGPRAMNSKNS